MDASTRPWHHRRQKPAQTLRALAAFLFALPVLALPLQHLPASAATASASTDAEIPKLLDMPESTASLSDDTAPEVSISAVAPGRETLSVTARLTSLSPNSTPGVVWQVRDDAGQLLVDETGTEASRPLPPGSYQVEATYGAVTVKNIITLPPGNSVAVSLVLNAGGLRVLPSLKGIAEINLPSETRVFALNGAQKGQRVAVSHQPGEMLKLPAGRYRIESRFGDGNTSAVTDVMIRPGRMSAVEVAHTAGLARLAFVGAPSANVAWTVRSMAGAPVSEFEGLTHSLALKPGSYVAEATVNGEQLSARFNIAAGEERDILLGN